MAPANFAIIIFWSLVYLGHINGAAPRQNVRSTETASTPSPMPASRTMLSDGDFKMRMKKPRLFGDCYKEDDCVGCVKRKSWAGSYCRWCPVDSACHSYGSIKNPCTEAQCINSTSKCSSKLPTYDPHVAWKQIVLSSAAYSDDPQKCLNHAPMTPPSMSPPPTSPPSHQTGTPKWNGGTFVVIDRISSHCDMLGNKCFAYTAISRDLGVIALSFRGTHAPTQLLIEILETMVAPRITVLGGKVQRYFMNAFNTLWPCIKNGVQRLVKKHPTFKVYVTGHSLGGALANIAASLLVDEGVVTTPNLIQYTFGEPRVGNFHYAYQHDIRVNNSWRVVHYRDIVPHIPLCLDPFCSGEIGGPYQHGIEIFYDAVKMNVSSPYKVCQGNPHNEDFGCSNGRVTKEPCIDINDCIAYHLSYYGIGMSEWPKTDCRPETAFLTSPRSSSSSSPSYSSSSSMSSSSDIDYSLGVCHVTPTRTLSSADLPPPPPLLFSPSASAYAFKKILSPLSEVEASRLQLLLLFLILLTIALIYHRGLPRRSWETRIIAEDEEKGEDEGSGGGGRVGIVDDGRISLLKSGVVKGVAEYLPLTEDEDDDGDGSGEEGIHETNGEWRTVKGEEISAVAPIQ